MHLKTNNMMRWLIIAAFGGYGISTLIDGILNVWVKADTDWNAAWFFLLPFMLVYSGLFIAVAYFVLRRKYRHLCTLVSVLAAVFVFGFLISLPESLGLYELSRTWDDSPWFGLIAFPLSLAALVIPFYAAGWAYRRGQAILSRLIPDHTPQSK